LIDYYKKRFIMLDFKFKTFEEMSPEDYQKIGFKSGLEVHQQLYSDTKLFSRAKAGIYSHEYNAEILRHMRPTLSELGEYDGTALMEFKTKKNIVYRINYDTVSTYEMDDTPPFKINDTALDTAIEISLLLDAKVVDEVHIARKQYLDGSIPTGFQRTAIVCVGGKLKYKDRDINLIQMSIEEDSCREESDKGHERIYLTDRLGMPLIETVTEPEMKTPQEVAEVNQIIREINRSTGKVRTGIGAGRQDVNVSVEGGTRIEIKGVPRIKMIPRLTYNEAMRQYRLLQLREELEKRGITENTFESDYFDVTKILKKTGFTPIQNAIETGHFVNAVVLKGFKGLMNWQTQTDTYFSKEISDRVRVIACLTTLPNIIHSDNPMENIATSEWRKIKETIGATSDDVVVLVWGSDEDVEMASKEIVIRAKEATIGVPSETRQALEDGTNGFERILPGPERMYPDTDLPPIEIEKERLERIKAGLPEKVWLREEWYREAGVPEDLIHNLKISKYANFFKKMVKENGCDAKAAAKLIIKYPKTLKRKGYDISVINEDMLSFILNAYINKEIVKDGLLKSLENCNKFKKCDKSLLPPVFDDEIISNAVDSAFEEIKAIELHNPDNRMKMIVCIAMSKLRGSANGSQVKMLVDKMIQEGK
jgi:glutamyl-tRNA(Gln) amidotransferase subunit E